MKLTLLVLLALASSILASPFFDRLKPHGRPSSLDIEDESYFYRLPGTTVPEEYDIQWFVDPTLTYFTGETKIWLRAMEETDTIVLHGYDLSYNSIVLKDDSGTELAVGNATGGYERQLLFITLDDNSTLVENGRYELIIKYAVFFGALPMGLYKNYYFKDDGKLRYFAATKFKPTYARHAFPCYDEPSYKAFFTIHIHHPEDLEAMSNMDIVPSTIPPMPNMIVTSFRTTPKMSTYSLAVVVSDFIHKSNTVDGTVIYPKEYRIYTEKRSIEYIDYALDFGQRSIAYLENYTDHVDRMPKLDSVVIPREYYAGPVENWGLITYDEDTIYYVKGVTSAVDEMLLCFTMSHVNAHFFFGNEVTAFWWDYVWLNEGFATYFAIYSMDKVKSGWRTVDEFVVKETQYMMIKDSTPYTHPMNTDVESPSDIRANFDEIAFIKAGSIVRMMLHLVGEQLFQAAVSSYINNLPTGLTTPDILYEEIEKVIGNTIQFTENGTFSDVFRLWANQSGYPVINMTSITGSTTVVVTQQRFYSDPTESSNETWWIPFTWTKSSNLSFATDKSIVISPNTKEYYITVEENAWYIANLQQSGYYRVMYDLKNWEKLIFALSEANHTRIHPLNKAQLLDDAFTFSLADRLSFNVTLGIVNYLQGEDDYIPWISASRGLHAIEYWMPASTQYNLYKQFIQKMVTKIFNSVEFDIQEDDQLVTRRTRTEIFEIACKYDLPECLLNAQRILTDEANNSSQKMDSDLKEIAYCHGLKNAPRELWDYVLERFGEESWSRSPYDFLSYLACSNDNDTIDDFLQMALYESVVDLLMREDIITYVALYGGPVGVDRTIAFLIEYFEELKSKLPAATARIIPTVALRIVTPQQIVAFDEFVDRYAEEFDANELVAVEQARQNIEENRVWIDRNMKDIDSWLLTNA